MQLAHMSRLEAVNEILWTIGEAAVQTITAGLTDAAKAAAILDLVSREVQMIGWHANTEKAVALTRNASNEFVIAVDILSVDTSTAVPYGRNATYRPSSHLDVALRQTEDGTGYRLYDKANNTVTWDNLDTITVDLVRLLDFAALPPALQTYIWTKAARRFQKGAMGSQVLHSISREEEYEAMINAIQADEAADDFSFFRSNTHLRNATQRYSPFSTS